MTIELLNMDCMDYLKTCSDGEFDLAIVDPPYGIDAAKRVDRSRHVKQKNGTKTFLKDGQYKAKDWDKKSPDREYFDELIRVSKHQIIWGVNYYNNYEFGAGRIVWDKLNDHSDQSDCEIAYNSIDNRVEIIRYLWSGFMQGLLPAKDCRTALQQIGNKKENEKRIHPTQKPVKLYSYLLHKYAKKNTEEKEFKIIDTHSGSNSLAIACHMFGCSLVAMEKDEDYYKDSLERYNRETQQMGLF